VFAGVRQVEPGCPLGPQGAVTFACYGCHLVEAEAREAFRALRAPEYQELMALCRQLLERARGAQQGYGSEWRKAQKRFEEIRRMRRFADSGAQFVFADPAQYVHREGEIRFAMFDGEYTHEGDLCTFEVLLARSGAVNPGLRAVAEVVHDIDLQDGKCQRPEAPGIATRINPAAPICGE